MGHQGCWAVLGFFACSGLGLGFGIQGAPGSEVVQNEIGILRQDEPVAEYFGL